MNKQDDLWFSICRTHELAWLIPEKRSRVMYSEACAEMLGFDDAWRFDPCALRSVARRL